jgi:hypothetical protein
MGTAELPRDAGEQTLHYSEHCAGDGWLPKNIVKVFYVRWEKISRRMTYPLCALFWSDGGDIMCIALISHTAFFLHMGVGCLLLTDILLAVRRKGARYE